MKHSLIPIISDAIYVKLLFSKTKDVVLTVYGDKYDIYEYEDDSKFEKQDIPSWRTTSIVFSYANRELPTVEDIQKMLYDTFERV